MKTVVVVLALTSLVFAAPASAQPDPLLVCKALRTRGVTAEVVQDINNRLQTNFGMSQLDASNLIGSSINGTCPELLPEVRQAGLGI